MNLHEISSSPLTPPEFPLKPRQPITMAGDLFRLDEPPPDLDDVGNRALAENADRLGVLKYRRWRYCRLGAFRP